MLLATVRHENAVARWHAVDATHQALGIVTKYGGSHTSTATEVNGEPALALVERAGGTLDAVCVLTVDGGVVSAIHFVSNPEKLAAVTTAAS